MRNVRSAKDSVQDFGRMRESATLDVDDRPARQQLTEYERTIRNYTRSWSQRGIRTRITADIRRAQRNLRTLEALAEEATEEQRVEVEAETTRARERLRALEQLARSVGAQSPTVSVGVRGAAASMATMLGLQTVADRLDGYNVRIGVDMDRRLSTALPNALGALEQQLLRFRTVSTAIAAVTVPTLYTAYASLPGVISTVGVAASALGVALAQGLAGGLSIAAGAAVLGGTALIGYGVAVSRTIGQVAKLAETFTKQKDAVEKANEAQKTAHRVLRRTRRGTEAHRRALIDVTLANQQARLEEEKLAALYDIATPRLLKLNKALGGAQVGAIRFGGAIMHEVAPAIFAGLNAWDRFRGSIQRGATGMARDMTSVSQSLIRTATSGQELESLTTILTGVRRSGAPALRAVGNAALTAVNAFAPLVPYSLALIRRTNELTDAARRWTGSASGQRRMASIWGLLAERAAWLGRVLGNTTAGAGGFFAALDQSGLVDYVSRRVEVLSGSFAALMGAAGDGRAAVVKFGDDVLPILGSTERLAGDLADGFFSLTNTFATFRNEASGELVSVEIIDSLRYMANQLIPFLRHEFEMIGPLLPPLIRALTDWFVVFGRAQPEMKFFIRFITDALEAFNSLPEPMRIAIARTSAWIFALKALGGFALLGTLGKMMFFYNQMNKRLPVLAANQRAYNRSARAMPTFGGGRIPQTGRMAPPVVPPPVPAKRFWRRIPRVAPPVTTPPAPPPAPARGYWRRVPKVAPPPVSPTVPPPSPARGYWKRVPRVAPPVPAPTVPAPVPQRRFWRRTPRVAPPMVAPTVPAPVPQRGYWRRYPRVGPPIFAPTIPAPIPARGFWRRVPRRTPPVRTPPVAAPVPARGFFGTFLARLGKLRPVAAIGGFFAAVWKRIPFGRQIGNAFRKIGFGAIMRFVGIRLIGGLLGFLLGPVGWILLAYSLIDMLTGGWLSKKLAPVFKWIGKNIIGGIVDGIQYGWDKWLKPALTWIGNAAPNWLKRILGIKSHSTVGKYIGRMTGGGIAEGIMRSLPEIERSARAASDAAMLRMRDYRMPSVEAPVVSRSSSVATGGRAASDGESARKGERQRWKSKQRPPVYMVVDGRVLGELVGERLEEYLQ